MLHVPRYRITYVAMVAIEIKLPMAFDFNKIDIFTYQAKSLKQNSEPPISVLCPLT